MTFVKLPLPNITNKYEAPGFTKETRDAYLHHWPDWLHFRSLWGIVLAQAQDGVHFDTRLDSTFAVEAPLTFYYPNYGDPAPLFEQHCGTDPEHQERAVPAHHALALSGVHVQMDTTAEGPAVPPLSAYGFTDEGLAVVRFPNFSTLDAHLTLGALPEALAQPPTPEAAT